MFGRRDATPTIPTALRDAEAEVARLSERRSAIAAEIASLEGRLRDPSDPAAALVRALNGPGSTDPAFRRAEARAELAALEGLIQDGSNKVRALREEHARARFHGEPERQMREAGRRVALAMAALLQAKRAEEAALEALVADGVAAESFIVSFRPVLAGSRFADALGDAIARGLVTRDEVAL